MLDDYFRWKLEAFKLDYYLKGFNLYPGELSEWSPQAFAELEAKCLHFGDRADEMLRQDKFDNLRDKRYVKILKFETSFCQNGAKFKTFLLAPVNFMSGIQSSLPQIFKLDGYLKTETLEDYQDILNLLKSIPQRIQEVIKLLGIGIKNGITLHNASMSRVPAQFENLLNYGKVEDTAFYQPFEKLLGDSAQVQNIQEEAKRIIHHEIMPSYESLKVFLTDEYSRHLRDLPAISSIDSELYEKYLEYHTSIKGITPEEVHNTGLDEVKRLRQEMMLVVQNELGLANSSFKAFAELLNNDAKQEFESRDEILDYFNKIIQESMEKLTSIFNNDVLNEDTFQMNMNEVPKGGGGLAYYVGPTIDGRRQGAFFLNTQNVKATRKFEANSLTLHEGTPGHHLQFGFNKHSPVPDFLRFTASNYASPGVPPGYYTAHVEGWGLYSEYLGFEMGMFEDPYQKIGFYSWNLLRAARLVVDSGLHSFAWSRERAINYLLDNTLMSQHNAEQQIDR